MHGIVLLIVIQMKEKPLVFLSQSQQRLVYGLKHQNLEKLQLIKPLNLRIQKEHFISQYLQGMRIISLFVIHQSRV